jgi:phytoene synthase
MPEHSAAAPPRSAPDAAIRRGSRSFALASRLFERELRYLVWDLYAWCRHCDDVIDGQRLGSTPGSVSDAASRLEALRRQTYGALAGVAEPESPFAALARVAAATQLPPRMVRDHLDGFAMDVAQRRFMTLDDTVDYGYHVAGVVGLMMAWIMGVRDREVLCRASDLGIAFQLSNIARDVGDDALAGRIYLPETWLDEVGVRIARGRRIDAGTAARLAPLVARLVAEAERYYDSAIHGIAALPGRSAWAVATARLVYRRIGRRTVARGAEALHSRTVVGGPFKMSSVVVGGWQAARLKGARTGDAPARATLYTPATIATLR